GGLGARDQARGQDDDRQHHGSAAGAALPANLQLVADGWLTPRSQVRRRLAMLAERPPTAGKRRGQRPAWGGKPPPCTPPCRALLDTGQPGYDHPPCP